MRSFKIFALILAAVSLFNTGTIFSQWQSANYLLSGYRAYCLHQTDSVLYCGTYEDGYFYSTDDGASWKNNKSFLRTIQLLVKNNNIYLTDFSNTISKSTDNGKTWIYLNNGIPGGTIIRSFVYPNANIYALTDSKVYKSTNDGVSFFEITNGLTISGSYKLASNGTNLYAATNQGLFYTTNDGVNWLSTPITAFSYDVFAEGQNVYTINNAAVFYSSNGGANFSSINSGNPVGAFHVIADGQTVIAGSWQRLSRSLNNGVNWNQCFTLDNSGLLTREVMDFSKKNGVIYVVIQNGGVFKSSDNGANWIKCSAGLPGTLIHSLEIYNTALYAGHYAGGITNRAITGTDSNWFYLNTSLYDHETMSYLRQGAVMYCGTKNGGFFRRSGSFWIQRNSGLSNLTVRALCLSAALNIFAGTDSSIYKTTNEGVNWIYSGNGINSKKIYSIYSDGTSLFAGADSGKIYKSTDEGANWNLSNTGIPSKKINSITFSSGKYYASSDSGLYSSSNAGALWSGLNNGLLAGRVNCVYVYASNIFCATAQGVFKSTDAGLNWVNYTSNLPYNDTRALVSDGTYLYAGTYGDGVYKILLSSLTGINSEGNNIPRVHNLKQNYPNPFNPSTKINFSIPADYNGETSLKVYDISGRLINTLVQQNLKPGNYDVSFDASGYSSGVYFYTLTSGTYRETKKMLFIK